MSANRARILILGPVLLFALQLHGCTPPPLPSTGLKHAVAAMDRAMLAAAFVVEASRDRSDPGIGLFNGANVNFLHGYAADCRAGDRLGEALGRWSQDAIRVEACDGPDASFYLTVYDEDDPTRRRTEIQVWASSPPDGNRLVRTRARIVDDDADDGPPLRSGSVYDLLNEITDENKIAGRTFLEASKLYFNMEVGGTFVIDYREPTDIVFDAPECSPFTPNKVRFQALVKGGKSGLPEALAQIGGEGYECIADGDHGGPFPGRFEVTLNGERTDAELLAGGDMEWMEFRASNSIGGQNVEIYVVLEQSRDKGRLIVADADYLLNNDWFVARKKGAMTLSLNFHPQAPPESVFLFESFFDVGVPEGRQEEPTLIGIFLVMDMRDDWCDRDEDGDGLRNCDDPCPFDTDPDCGWTTPVDEWCAWDDDGDGLPNCEDPCPFDPDPDCGLPGPGEDDPGMVTVPAGCFDMGDGFAEGSDAELPVHQVCVSAFEMDENLVTNIQYKACVIAGECPAPIQSDSYRRVSYYGDTAYEDFPVIWVSWSMARAFCAWAGKRLPSEAEWEYAARGGLSGKRFPWGGDSPDMEDDIDCDDANYGRGWADGACYDHGGIENDTTPAGFYAPNGYGLHDMAGNVWQWVEDDYHGSYDCEANPGAESCEAGGTAPVDGSAWVDSPRGENRVLRGGTYYWDSASYLRVTNRGHNYHLIGSGYAGFRCAR